MTMDDTLPYRLSLPDPPRSAVIFASPHSGSDYPEAFVARSNLDLLRLRSSEDAFVDTLVASAPTRGAALIAARYPRAYVDLNRDADELDPAIIDGLDPRPVRNARIAAGLGVIPRVVSGGRVIHPGKIPLAEAETRIATIWHPYHDALAALISTTRARFGHAILFDMHSMPSDAVAHMGDLRPQIVLGDRFGNSASKATTAFVEAAFAAEGLRVMRNAPFSGAYVTRHYGRPAQRVEVVQIEIDRSLYMDEISITQLDSFPRFAALMERVVARLVRAGHIEALAAE